MKIAQAFLLVLMLFGLTQVARSDDLADLQGTWEMVQKQNGVEHRVIKTIQDGTETVQVFLNGALTQKHVVEISVETFGPVKVFQWKNGQITEGPNKGKQLPDGRCIYRLEDKTWIAVHGLLKDDKKAVMIEVFKRPPPAPAA